jgi:hypothetical protein
VVARNVPSAHRAAKAVHLQVGAVIVQNVRRAVIVQNALPAAKAVNIRRAQKAALMCPVAVPAMVPVGPAESFRAVRARAANSPVVRAQKGAAMMPVRALQNHSAATSANHARKVRLQVISNHAPHAVSSQIVRHDQSGVSAQSVVSVRHTRRAVSAVNAQRLAIVAQEKALLALLGQSVAASLIGLNAAASLTGLNAAASLTGQPAQRVRNDQSAASVLHLHRAVIGQNAASVLPAPLLPGHRQASLSAAQANAS